MTFFNPIGTAFINVRFACLYCQAEVSSGYLPAHAPNFAGKEAKDSYINEDHDAVCDECGEICWMIMHVGKNDAYIEMENSEISKAKVDEISEEELEYQAKQFEAISDNTDLFQTFKSGIEKLKKLNAVNLENKELDHILKLQIYTGIISTMETFLSDAFINLTLKDENRVKKFVQSYPDFRQRKIELREIFEHYEKIHDTVKSILLEIIYHDLRKVREMYRSTFEINFPDLESPIKCVLVRHDIVHRNGKTKDGEVLIISTQDVFDAISIIDTFISNIAKQLDLA